MPAKARKDHLNSAAQWREEYDNIVQDEGESEHSETVSEEIASVRLPQVNMSQLLRSAKVKEEKLQSGYDFVASPASKVVIAEDSKGPSIVGTGDDDDWVDLKDDSDSTKKGYSEVVKGM